MQSIKSEIAAVTSKGIEPVTVGVSQLILPPRTAQAVSSALFARAMGRVRGHHVELSMLDASLQFLWPDTFWNHGFVGADFQRKPLIAEFYRVLQTADGYVTTIVVGDEEFKGACGALDLPELLDQPRFASIFERFTNYAELLVAFAEKTRLLSSAEVVERMESAQLQKVVQEAVAKLPDNYRTVIVLRDIEGLSTEEAAEALGIRPEAAKMRLHRARQALRTLLAPHFAAEA